MRRTITIGAAGLLASLLVAGCASGSPHHDAAGRGTPTSASSASPTPTSSGIPPLPKTVPTAGPVTDPLLKPVWLIRATGTEESSDYRTHAQGAFLDGDVAVYYAYDTVMGVSVKTGDTVWKSPVDMQGQVVDHAGVREASTSTTHRWTFVYADGRDAVTIDTQTGRVIADKGVDSVDAMVSDGETDYLANDKGIFRINDAGVPTLITPAARITHGSVGFLDLAPVHGTHVAVAQTNRSLDESFPRVVAGVDLRTGKVLWSRPESALAKVPKDKSLTLNAFDGRYLSWTKFGADNELLHLLVLDPKTGKVVKAPTLNQESFEATDHRLGLEPDALDVTGSPHALTMVGDDVIVSDYHGISRYSPLTNTIDWTLRAGNLGTRHGTRANFDIGPTTPDGRYLYATFSSGNSGDVLLIDTGTGHMVGRWALDDEQDAGLVAYPLMAARPDGLLLARNRATEGRPDVVEQGIKPLGPVNDLGWFQFPASS